MSKYYNKKMREMIVGAATDVAFYILSEPNTNTTGRKKKQKNKNEKMFHFIIVR